MKRLVLLCLLAIASCAPHYRALPVAVTTGVVTVRNVEDHPMTVFVTVQPRESVEVRVIAAAGLK